MTLLEVAATLVSLSAAANMTLGKPTTVWISMFLWLMGSILWFSVGVSIDNMALIVTSVGYFVLEIISLIRWWRIRNDR